MDDVVTEHHGEWGSLAIARHSAELEPAVIDERRITVLIGDPIARLPGRAAALIDDARRQLLHEATAREARQAWGGLLDGHFAFLEIDRASGGGVLLTDRFAFVPVFHVTRTTAIDAEIVVGTHVDAVARLAEMATRIDIVSVADFAATLTSTPPFTLYEGVRQAEAGCTRPFASGRWAGAPDAYWVPTEEPSLPTFHAATATLRSGFRDGIMAACAGLDRVGLLLSGGEDSRAILGAMPSSARARGFVYAEWASREVRIAQAAGRAHGIGVAVGVRGPDHYLDGFESVASLIGSSHLFMDVHGFGFHETFGLRALPIVIGGLSSDSLLKAEHAPKRSSTERLLRPVVEGVRPDILAAVGERRTAFRDRLAVWRPETADEWISLWPFSMRRHGGNVDGNRRLFRSWEAFHATAVLDVAIATPRRWKERRTLFRTAMRPFLRPTRFLPHAEYRFPYFGPLANLLLLPPLALARGMRSVFRRELRARHRPWPKWATVATSEAASHRWSALRLEESPVAGLFASRAARDMERAIATWHPLHQLMLLQLVYTSREAAA